MTEISNSSITKSNHTDGKEKHSLFIGLKVTGVDDLAILGGEDVKDFHITLLYGYFTPGSDEEDAQVCVKSAIEAVREQIPGEIEFDALGRFGASTSSDGKNVIYAQVAKGQLEGVHEGLLEELRKNGIRVEKTFHTYHPHMTLAYIDPGSEYDLKEINRIGHIGRIAYGMGPDNSRDHEQTNPAFRVAKADSDKMQVFGWASVSNTEDGSEVADWEGDVIKPDELERAAYEYVLEFRDTGERHDPDYRKKGKLIESVVFTEEKQQAMGLKSGSLPEGWWVGFQINDEDTWQKIKNGEYRMFSVEGKGRRRDYDNVKKRAPSETFGEIIEKRLTLSTDEVRYSCDKEACSFEEVIQKYNMKHGADGRFAESSSANGKGGGGGHRHYSNSDYIKAVKNRKTKNNITIKEIHPHAFDSAKARGIDPKNVANTIIKGTVLKSNKPNRTVHQWNGTKAVVQDNGHKGGTLVTTYYIGKKGKKK